MLCVFYRDKKMKNGSPESNHLPPLLLPFRPRCCCFIPEDYSKSFWTASPLLYYSLLSMEQLAWSFYNVRALEDLLCSKSAMPLSSLRTEAKIRPVVLMSFHSLAPASLRPSIPPSFQSLPHGLIAIPLGHQARIRQERSCFRVTCWNVPPQMYSFKLLLRYRFLHEV